MFKFISPIEFFTAFKSACEANEAELAAKYEGSLPAFTQFVREVLFRDVAETLQVQYYSADFSTLDGVMYCSKDGDNFKSHTTFPHALCVALEHENDPNTSMGEMNKLQHVNVSLKVLVTYPNGQSAADVLLKRYAKAIEQADVFADFSTKRRQLVIFGSKPGASPEWQGYTYDNGNFLPLQ